MAQRVIKFFDADLHDDADGCTIILKTYNVKKIIQILKGIVNGKNKYQNL